LKRKSVVWFGIVTALFLVFSCFEFRTKTIRQNDSAAVGRLRRLNDAQLAYIASHPTKGFACNMPDLSESEQYSGYKFLLSCDARSSGSVSSYQLVAQPLEPGRTGLRTYCVTEERQIWYDGNGSVTNCLRARQPIVE
jgi:hypothetical protein